MPSFIMDFMLVQSFLGILSFIFLTIDFIGSWSLFQRTSKTIPQRNPRIVIIKKMLKVLSDFILVVSNAIKKDWYVYLLECMDGSFYTGVTNNIDARMNAHSIGKGSKYVYRK